jgi:hypothetical protein
MFLVKARVSLRKQASSYTLRKRFSVGLRRATATGPDSGKYVAADDGTLTVAWPLAVTVQLCSSPEGIMEQEAAYIEALQSAAIYRVADHRLEIDDTAGEMILVFAKKGE